GRRKIVGVNVFEAEMAKAPKAKGVLRVSPKLEAEQVRRLKAFKARRDQKASACALQRLGAAAKTAENLFPLILAAVEARATLGEICNALRKEFGEYHAS